jgi:hypothetical protein
MFALISGGLHQGGRHRPLARNSRAPAQAALEFPLKNQRSRPRATLAHGNYRCDQSGTSAFDPAGLRFQPVGFRFDPAIRQLSQRIRTWPRHPMWVLSHPT